MNNNTRKTDVDLSEQLTGPLEAIRQSAHVRENVAQVEHVHGSKYNTIHTQAQTAAQWQYAPAQQFSYVQRPRRFQRKAVLFVCLAVFLLLGSLSAVGMYLYQNYSAMYAHDKALAQDGIQHLQTAQQLMKSLLQTSPDLHNIVKARQAFVGAGSDFSQLSTALQQVPPVAKNIPKYGALLSGAQHMVPLALELSQGGIIGCNILTLLISHLSEPLTDKSQGITLQDLTVVKQDIVQLKQMLNTVAEQINALQPSDLQIDPRVGPAMATFKVGLPALQSGLRDTQAILNIAPTFLGIGTPSFYLVELLDSTELRPGGGFVGNFGIASTTGGRITKLHIEDTYLLDQASDATGHQITLPRDYQWFPLANTWGLRDSNLDADFPTVARYAEQLYHTETTNQGQKPTALQGVLAITPSFVENLLKITGSIYVKEYHETITPQNVINRIHFYQLKEDLNKGDVPSPDGHSSLRKRFTEFFGEYLFARLRQVAPGSVPKLWALLRDGLHMKDMQIYFNSHIVQAQLEHYQLASQILAPPGDSLFTVDANINSSSSNAFMNYVLRDQITITTSGDAIHHMTLIRNVSTAITCEFMFRRAVCCKLRMAGTHRERAINSEEKSGPVSSRCH
ncbi:MAG: hypothetical protein NVSMB33_07780 [Ktedonobacteraceae bacterium]